MSFFKTRPMDHQMMVYDLQKDKEAYGLLLEQGLGKTKIDLDTTAYLFLSGKIDRKLVIAPNGVHLNWADEIKKHLSDDVRRRIFVWTGRLSSKEVSAMKVSMMRSDELTILLINVEALSSSESAKDQVRKFANDRTMTTVDESTRVKNVSSKRTKFVLSIGRSSGYRRILTGTPVTQSPFDLYGQFAFLDPRILGFSSFFSFKKRYGEFVTQQAVQNGRTWQYDKLVKYQRLGELSERIAPYSIRLRKADCLDLPEKIYKRIPIILTPMQQKLYKEMDRDGVVNFDSFEVLSPLRITRLTKMQQIVGGFLMTEAGGVPLSGRNPKMETFLDVVEDHPGQMIISCRFRHEIEMICGKLRRLYGNRSVVEYHGDVRTVDRHKAIQSFQEGEARFLVGQERALIGINLTAAEAMIFWSNEFSQEVRYQCEDRAHRIGQKKNVVYIDLVGIGTVDERVLQVLENCRRTAEKIVDHESLRRQGSFRKEHTT
jgi:SNF2 family DNA or RNA helicase